MTNTGSRCGAKQAVLMQRRVLTAVGAAVCIALYGAANPARADDAAQASADTPIPVLQEITVTASRRTQTEESTPYSLTVISPQQLANANVTDISSLTSQVPGLSMYDFGARFAGATVPIIRGINATGSPRGFRSFEQSPVGVYVGNSPMDDYIGLIDLQRIEVLRGPQGTLYGAGALGGAIRLIPNDPQLDTFSGQVEAGADRIAHSSGTGYTFDGVLNLPVGHELALRLAAK